MLLAVVHGPGASGWRDPQARQAYLLTVSLEGRITVRKQEALLARATRSERRLPRLRGDLLYEDAGRRYLYWTGSRYAWHAALASAELAVAASAAEREADPAPPGASP